MRRLALGLFLFVSISAVSWQSAAAQEEAAQEEVALEQNALEQNAPRQMDVVSRGSIPEELLRPKRGESPRYPIDTVIGELGRGTASEAAFTFANNIGTALLSGDKASSALASIEKAVRENLLSSLEAIVPVSFRIGGGREEADGAVSFLVRFIGKDQGITGELYIRHITKQTQGQDEEVKTVSYWVFEELLLEEAKDREVEQKESIYRHDFYPYERFY
ncbi:hypothetical protein R84B8_00563 [Treponema sp. R8-4-B8]